MYLVQRLREFCGYGPNEVMRPCTRAMRRTQKLPAGLHDHCQPCVPTILLPPPCLQHRSRWIPFRRFQNCRYVCTISLAKSMARPTAPTWALAEILPVSNTFKRLLIRQKREDRSRGLRPGRYLWSAASSRLDVSYHPCYTHVWLGSQ